MSAYRGGHWAVIIFGHNMTSIDRATLRAKGESIRVSSVMYYVAFGLYSTGAFLELTTFYELFGSSRELIISLFQAFALALLVVKFCTQKASVLGWFCAAAAVLLGYLSWRQGNEGWFFWLVLFISCSDGISLRALAGLTLGIVLALTALTVACCSFGLIENRMFARVDSVRYAWGFKHPNYFGAYLLLICTCVSALRFGKSPWPDILLIIFVIILNVSILDSRSSALLAMAQIVMLLIFYNVRRDKSRRRWSIIFVLGMMFVIAASVYFMINYDDTNVIHKNLNDILSLRLSLSHGYYSMQPLTLFGDDFIGFPPIYWENGQPATFIVDNAFCHLILRSGVLSMAAFVCGLFGLLFKKIKNRQWDAVLFGIVLMTLYGVGETLGIRVECNFFLIAIGTELIFANRHADNPGLIKDKQEGVSDGYGPLIGEVARID